MRDAEDGMSASVPPTGGAPGSSGPGMALSASRAGAAVMTRGGVAAQSAERRTARMYRRVEPLVLSSIGVAIAGFLALMAAIGLALGAMRPAITSDAGTALSTAKAAVSGNHQWIDILAPPAQVAVYAPFVAFGHPELASIVPALFGAFVLVMVVAAAWRITGMLWAGAVTGLLLLSSPEYWQRASQLPAYQQFAFFGYLGLLLTAAAIHRPNRSCAFAIAGGVALALSVYSFTAGLAFLPAALLLALAWRGRWKPALTSLATAAVLLAPFAVWHIVVAGVRKAFYYPHNFILVNYLEHFTGFYGRPDYDLSGYVTEALPSMLVAAAPIWLWLLAAAGLLALGRVHGARVAAAITAAFVTMLIPIVIVQPSAQPRYVYMTVPAVALVAGVGLAFAVQSLARHRGRRHLSTLAAPAIALLAVFSASTAISAHLDQVRAVRASPRYAELQAVATKIDDDRALLARASYLQVLLPHNQVYTANFISEDQYLDYVLWQDERQVRQFLAGRDIGWVVFQKNVDRWERDYNFWAYTATGDPPRHYVCLPQSAAFSDVHDGYFFTLYRVKQNWLRAESAVASCVAAPEERWSLPGAWRRAPAGPTR